MGVDGFMSDSVGKNVAKVQYELLRRKGQKRITLRVTDAGRIVVSAPMHASATLIERFVQSKTDWIAKRQELVRELPPALAAHTWEDGDRFLYLGEELVLHLRRNAGSCVPGGLSLVVDVSARGGKAAIKAAVRRWYEERALELYRRLVDFWCAELGLPPVHDVAIVGYPRRMGSCSHRGQLRFALRSIMLPLPLVAYLALHEVAHLVHFNHGSDFKRLLDTHMPDWRQRQREMDRLRLRTASI
jgi:predicted metal-dependent hydrolase